MKMQMTTSLLVLALSASAMATPPEAGRLDEKAYQKALAMEKVAKAQNTFGSKMFTELSKANQSNLFFSPVSASLALSMTSDGARGQTATAMQAALQLTGVSASDIDLGNSALIESLSQKADGFTVQIANSIWVKNGFSVYPSFVKQAQDSYQAEVQNLDFTSPTASTTINNWVSEKTNGKITAIVPKQLPESSRVILINATYLKADWQVPFKAISTRDADFNLVDGSKKSVKSMYASGHYMYSETADYQALELPYKGGTASMIVVLPKVGRLDAVGQALSTTLVDDLSKAMAPGTQAQFGTLQLPKFVISTESDLGNSLSTLGMGLAFSDNADFGAMSSSPVFITGVVQKVYIAVDEKGTEAAAVTAVMAGASSMPRYDFRMNVDRPFYVFIRDTRSNAVLFEGRVMNPAP